MNGVYRFGLIYLNGQAIACSQIKYPIRFVCRPQLAR